MSQGVIVPWRELSEAALRGVIEEFVTREGTEYGLDDVTLDRKVEEVHRQLERGDVLVTWDESTETVQLVTRRDFHGDG